MYSVLFQTLNMLGIRANFSIRDHTDLDTLDMGLSPSRPPVMMKELVSSSEMAQAELSKIKVMKEV